MSNLTFNQLHSLCRGGTELRIIQLESSLAFAALDHLFIVPDILVALIDLAVVVLGLMEPWDDESLAGFEFTASEAVFALFFIFTGAFEHSTHLVVLVSMVQISALINTTQLVGVDFFVFDHLLLILFSVTLLEMFLKVHLIFLLGFEDSPIAELFVLPNNGAFLV